MKCFRENVLEYNRWSLLKQVCWDKYLRRSIPEGICWKEDMGLSVLLGVCRRVSVLE